MVAPWAPHHTSKMHFLARRRFFTGGKIFYEGFLLAISIECISDVWWGAQSVTTKESRLSKYMPCLDWWVGKPFFTFLLKKRGWSGFIIAFPCIWNSSTERSGEKAMELWTRASNKLGQPMQHNFILAKVVKWGQQKHKQGDLTLSAYEWFKVTTWADKLRIYC